MRNRAILCDCHTFDRLFSLDPSSKSFPVYKQCVTKCKVIPENGSVKSYHVAVQRRQMCIVDSKKITCGQCKSFHPSRGFNLIEYADKSCSQNTLPQIQIEEKKTENLEVPQSEIPKEASEEEVVKKETLEKKVESKLVGPDCCACCHRSVHCDLIAFKKTWCLPPPPKTPCLKLKLSSEIDKSSIEKDLSCREILLCKKCQEKRMKKKPQNIPEKKCPCVKNKNGQRSGIEPECNAYKCKYLDLIQKIKCIFTKER